MSWRSLPQDELDHLAEDAAAQSMSLPARRLLDRV
jgi:hypothetical protein